MKGITALATAALLIVTTATTLSAQLPQSTTTATCQLPSGRPQMKEKKETPAFKVVIGKVNYKDDVTRAELSIIGMPHTSCRIDSIAAIFPTGKEVKATDIDPIDFQRYFQWEDEGSIDLEIDFPAGTRLKRGTVMQFSTSKGEVKYVFK
ncbi:MAG: hypothetical protein K2M04_08275 [Muribaculaceae bacterium]|nr:hypothetical protein [Muribaculaceae bacterium]